MSESVIENPTAELPESESSLDETSKRQREELNVEIELSKKVKSDSPVEGTVEHKTQDTEEKKSDDNKTITQHISYEEITKMAAAQVHAASGASQASHSTVTTPAATSNPSSTTIMSTLSPSGDSLIIEVSQEKVGQIIGSKGAIIQDMVC